MNDHMLDELKALHAPSRDYHDWSRPVCKGDDADGWEAEAPAWPCQTALIIWPAEEERAAVIADWHKWADPQREAVRAKYAASPPSALDRVMWSVYEERIKAQIDAGRFFDRLRDGSSVENAVIKFERK